MSSVKYSAKCPSIFISYRRVIVISILEYQILKRFVFSFVRIKCFERNICDLPPPPPPDLNDNDNDNDNNSYAGGDLI